MKITKKINSFLDHYSYLLVIIAIFSYIIFFSALSLWKYINFAYNGLDLAIINQVFYNSSLGDFFASSIHPQNYLGDHFSPILFILLPFYFITKTPAALLILQTLFLALSAWPLYLIGKKVLNQSLSLLLVLSWLLNPFVQNINLFEFSFLPLAIFFLFWAFYFYQKQKFLPFLTFSLLALFCREDVALVIFFFGILALIQNKKMRWRLTPIFLSIIYFFLAIKIISLFALNGSYKFFIYYPWLGGSWSNLWQNLIFIPGQLIDQIFSFNNLIFTLGLLIPFSLLPLISPAYLLLGLGIFLQLILRADGGSATILQTHYCSLLLPAIFVALIYSLKEVFLKTSSQKNLVLFLQKIKGLVGLVFVTGIIYSALTLGPIPGSLTKIAQLGFYSSASQNKAELLKNIDHSSAVAATYEFLTPLSSRQKIYSFNYTFLGRQQFLNSDYVLPADTRYLAIDFSDLLAYQLQYGQNRFYQKQYEAALGFWPNILANFGLIEVKDSLTLWQKGVANKKFLINDFSNQQNIANQKNIEISQNLKFLGFNQIDKEYQLFWDVILPLKKPVWFKLELTNQASLVYEKIYPWAYGLLGSSQPAIKKVQTNYWFELPKNIPPGTYKLDISLFEIEKGGLELNPLRSTENIIDKKTDLGQKIPLGEVNL